MKSSMLLLSILFSFLSSITATEVSVTVDVIKISAAAAEGLNLKSPGKNYTEAQYNTLLSQLKKKKQGIKVFAASLVTPSGTRNVVRNVTILQIHQYNKKWQTVPKDVGIVLEATAWAQGSNFVEMEIKAQCSFKESVYKFDNKNLLAIKEISLTSRLHSLSKSVQNIGATKINAKFYYVFMLHTNIINPNKNVVKNKPKNVSVIWDTLKVKSSEVTSLGLNMAGKKFSDAEYLKVLNTIKLRKIGYIDDSSSISSVSGKAVVLRNTKDLYHYNAQDKIHTRSFGSVLEYTAFLEADGTISISYKPQIVKIIGYRKKDAPILNALTQDSRSILKGEYMVIGSSQKGNITYISILKASSTQVSEK